jgi:SPX domain protein involved in polyphosphate accumulation
MLKEGSFTEGQEGSFVQKLETELEKVAAFRKIKGDELVRRLEHCELLVVKILNSSSDDPTRFDFVKKECSRVSLEVNELSKFIRLNYSGFLKVRTSFYRHLDP